MKGATTDLVVGVVGGIVSIHAPVKGATAKTHDTNMAQNGFNPRAREGRDIEWSARAGVRAVFQSTRP